MKVTCRGVTGELTYLFASAKGKVDNRVVYNYSIELEDQNRSMTYRIEDATENEIKFKEDK